MSREIDALVAEHVMGWVSTAAGELLSPQQAIRVRDGEAVFDTIEIPPRYSTDIKAAWEVVEKMRGERPQCADSYIAPYYWQLAEYYQGGWEVGFGNHIPYEGFSFDPTLSARAETAPMAICLAALKAKGVGYEAD